MSRRELPKRRSPAYDLIPAKVAQAIPRIGATDGQPDKLAHVRLFTPDSGWVWYVAEYDPEQRLAFGLVVSPNETLLN